jgi:ribosomal protein S18 acetylase RimI-like enzyme
MHAVLLAYREHIGDPERATLDQMRATYSHLGEDDPRDTVALIEHDGDVVAYARPTCEQLGDGSCDLVVFAPIRPDHLEANVYAAIVAGQERYLAERAPAGQVCRYRAYAVHPGPERQATGEAAWLETLGYVATEWGASLRRPNLDDVPDLPLPDGVAVRPVRPDQVRHVWEVHHEAFRGEWDFHEPTPSDVDRWLDDPVMDPSLWQVAWSGDQIVGQVKPFINSEENAERGYLRGYTEFISTHADWRNRGIASALLARSLVALRDRGMTEAVLGVDTNNPGGAFQVYTRLGFELQGYEAVYTKSVPTAR